MAAIRFLGTLEDRDELERILSAEGIEDVYATDGELVHDAFQMAQDYAVVLIAAGSIEAIKAAVRKFRERHPDKKVEVSEDDSGLDPRGYR